MARKKSVTWIQTEDGERIRVSEYAAVPADETEIVYVDSDGNDARCLRSEYKD